MNNSRKFPKDHRGGPGEPPSGLIAMLFCDIEGSTRLAAALGEEWAVVLGAYHRLVTDTVRSAGGWVDGSAGDGFFITFSDVARAAGAAVAIQRALRAHPWPPAAGELRARMGLHVGQVERRSHGYVGLEIHRAARVGAAAHGGQLLITGAAAELLGDALQSQPLGAHRLKDFPAPIALHCALIDGRGAASFPPPRTLELRPGSIPVAPGALIGREADLKRVRAALRREHERLLTLLGRGGAGKTSLALAVAHDLIEEYPGGIWWIDASHERDGAGLLAAIARGCRIESTGPLQEALVAELRSRGSLLLVLDNLEQVNGAAGMLEALLAQLPDVAMLVTSQLPLRCRGERQLQVDRLSEEDAVALLTRTLWRLDLPAVEDHGAAAELVRLLDGLPLAIELAAGRLRLFTLEQLLARLRQSTAILQDRGRPERQRSLVAALDWTLELLEPGARELFARLGVFAEPVELADIERLLGADGLDVIAAVEELLHAALLKRVESGDGLVRFGFPEAVRQEASRRLDIAGGETWRQAHASWQHERVWPLRIYEIAPPRLVEEAHALAAETRAALRWAWRRDRALWRELALGRFALAKRTGALQEARELLDHLLADPGEDPAVVDLLRTHAEMLGRADQGQADTRTRPLIELFPRLSDPHARFLCAQNSAIALTWEGRFEEALAWLERARALARALGPFAEAVVLVITADTLLEAGRPDAAAAAIAESYALAGGEQVRDRPAGSDVIRATLASVAGAHAEALDRHARALTDAELTGDSVTVWMLVVSLVRALARAGRERAMLEAAGVAQAIATERSAHGDFVPAVFADPEPAVTEALTRLGPAGQALLDAGRALAPGGRVKRLCALIYAA